MGKYGNSVSMETLNTKQFLPLPPVPEVASLGGPADVGAGCRGVSVGVQRQAGVARRRGHHPQGAHPRHRRCLLHQGRLAAPSGAQNRYLSGGGSCLLKVH